MNPKIFAGAFPVGISYADTTREEHGDYKKIALLRYSDLELIVYDAKSPLLGEVKEAAAKIQARRGEEYPVSMCQTITLGYALKEGPTP